MVFDCDKFTIICHPPEVELRLMAMVLAAEEVERRRPCVRCVHANRSRLTRHACVYYIQRVDDYGERIARGRCFQKSRRPTASGWNSWSASTSNYISMWNDFFFYSFYFFSTLAPLQAALIICTVATAAVSSPARSFWSSAPGTTHTHTSTRTHSREPARFQDPTALG